MLKGGSAAPALFSLEEPAAKDLYPGTFSRHAAAYKQRLDEVMARSESRGRAAVVDWVKPTPGKRILDLACGPGTLSYRLARNVSPTGEVMGIDRTAGGDLPPVPRARDQFSTRETVEDAAALTAIARQAGFREARVERFAE